jgi:hypothetical protein
MVLILLVITINVVLSMHIHTKTNEHESKPLNETGAKYDQDIDEPINYNEWTWKRLI